MKYFVPPFTDENIKKQFRELSKTLHPDKGGKQADFIAMQKEYEKVQILSKIKIPKKRIGGKRKKNNTFATQQIIIIDVKSWQQAEKKILNFLKNL